jgi:antitoxin PrlF
MGAQALLLEEYSTITAKGQTTVPKSVRQALGVGAGDQIAFRLDADGVTIHRVNNDQPHSDPAIGAFLQFLAKDMQANPSRLQALSPDLMASIGELVEGIEVDLDAPIEGEVAI